VAGVGVDGRKEELVVILSWTSANALVESKDALECFDGIHGIGILRLRHPIASLTDGSAQDDNGLPNLVTISL
jgi:hypothetical protein